MNTTNSGRVILRKRSEPISKSAKSNYQLWKLASTLSLSELSLLINKRRQDIKYETSSSIISKLREEMLLLSDAYSIKKRKNLNIDKSDETIHIKCEKEISELTNASHDIIVKLGYSQNTLYKEDVSLISQKIQMNIPMEVLATCIVKEVLDKYHSKYNEGELLSIFEIPEVDFYKQFIKFSLWCAKNYWKR